MGSVVAVLRYPLKSGQVERLQSVAVDRGGLRGDRAWACLEVADGSVGSAKHPRRWGRLLEVEARTDEGSGAGDVVLVVAGERVLGGTAEADAALTALVGRPVRLTRVVPQTLRLYRKLPDHHGLIPAWMSDAVTGQEIVIETPGAGDRFVDFGAVHLVTTGALARLAHRLGRADVDAVRFRPNLVLDAPEDPRPGQELRIGDVVLRVLVPTPRCVVPGISPDGTTEVDRTLLTALAQHYRTAVADLGRAACFGVYAEVLTPGRLGVGQPVR